MSFRSLILAACLIVCAVAALGVEKQRDWQTGKVLDTNRQRYFAGTVGNSNSNGTVDSSGNYHGNSSGGETAVCRRWLASPPTPHRTRTPPQTLCRFAFSSVVSPFQSIWIAPENT